MTSLTATLGRVTLKNPLIAGSAEHLIEVDGIRRALKAGVGAVIVKSVNESDAARDQLQRAEYLLLDEHWNPVEWGPNAPASAFVACLGLTPAVRSVAEQPCKWTKARAGNLTPSQRHPCRSDVTVRMARQIEQAGLRILNSISTFMQPGPRCGFPVGSRIGSSDGAQGNSPALGENHGSATCPDLAAAAFAAAAMQSSWRDVSGLTDIDVEPMLSFASASAVSGTSSDVSVAGAVARSRRRKAADRYERCANWSRHCSDAGRRRPFRCRRRSIRVPNASRIGVSDVSSARPQRSRIDRCGC